jgi:hypothetical protein
MYRESAQSDVAAGEHIEVKTVLPRFQKREFILCWMVSLYRGRVISNEDILYIKDLITANPWESRRTLSKKPCGSAR